MLRNTSDRAVEPNVGGSHVFRGSVYLAIKPDARLLRRDQRNCTDAVARGAAQLAAVGIGMLVATRNSGCRGWAGVVGLGVPPLGGGWVARPARQKGLLENFAACLPRILSIRWNWTVEAEVDRAKAIKSCDGSRTRLTPLMRPAKFRIRFSHRGPPPAGRHQSEETHRFAAR